MPLVLQWSVCRLTLYPIVVVALVKLKGNLFRRVWCRVSFLTCNELLEVLGARG